MTGLLLSADYKDNSYDLILVIVDYLTKIVHNKPVKVTIDALEITEVIIDMVVWYHGLSDFIINDCKATFTSKFWSSLYYLLGITRQFSTVFHPQINGQTK